VVERALAHQRLAIEVRTLHEQLSRVRPLAEQLGTSEAIGDLLEATGRVAGTDRPVLIAAEPGSGSELVARAIHARSARRNGPFVAVDCAAMAAEQIERELFGHERGAFPGADRRRPGQLELAAGGTVFLADVGALPLAAQGQLLAFLQERELQRVGGTERIAIDVRIIASAGPGLDEAVAGHLFRRDLYDHIAVARLAIPPLRERPDDVVFLVQRLLDATNKELRKQVAGVSPEALDRLVAHPWPGNVRELRQAIKRAVLLADERIEVEHLSLAPVAPQPRAEAPAPEAEGDESGLPLAERTRRAVERVETQAIAAALEQAGGNKRQAAKALGINYKTLLTKVKKYKLQSSGEPH